MERFILAQITDLHVKAGGKRSYRVVDTADLLHRCIDHVVRLPQHPDAVLLTGDLVDSGAPAEYATLRELLARLPMPCYLMPGNHDDRDNLRAAFPDHGYLHQWAPFVQYAIDRWPVRIVALDTVIPGESGGRLCPERLAWLERALEASRDRPVVVALHHPPFRTFIGHMDDIGLDGGEALAAIVRRHPNVERVLCGHLHRAIETRFGGTIASTCPSPAHQVDLDLADDAVARFRMEPPGFQVHVWTATTGIVSHTAAVGAFPGPYPFVDDASQID
jgi:3',5'-cyclic AMP phosphodiesterase CpdA